MKRSPSAHGGSMIGISHTILVAAEEFGPRLSAATVGSAIGAGLGESGLLRSDPYPLGALRPDFEDRMKAARAVVIASPRLDEHTLLGSPAFEIATRARQSGVPCYAITRENALAAFDARMLDLQVVIEARSQAALQKAGARLAKIV